MAGVRMQILCLAVEFQPPYETAGKSDVGNLWQEPPPIPVSTSGGEASHYVPADEFDLQTTCLHH